MCNVCSKDIKTDVQFINTDINNEWIINFLQIQE